MKKWIKQNWLKVLVVIIILVIGVCLREKWIDPWLDWLVPDWDLRTLP